MADCNTCGGYLSPEDIIRKSLLCDEQGNVAFNATLVSSFDALAPSNLILTVLSDTSIKLDFTINSTNADGHKIERSLDGVTYTEVTGVLVAMATYTDTGLTEGTRYYYRVRAYQGTSYSAYCTAANDWTAIKLVLTSTGLGTGVSTMRLWFNTTNVVATLDGAGKWYSNSGGTADESASYTFTAGSLQTRYLKVTSGVSNLLLFAKGNWKQWGDIVYNPVTGLNTVDLNGFVSSTNAATIAKDVSALTTLEKLYVTGNNTLSGSVAALTNLTYIRVEGSNTLSGSVEALTNMTFLQAYGSNTLSGSIAELTNLTLLYVQGSNTLSGSIAALTNLTLLYVTGSNTLSGSVAALTDLTYIRVEGSNTLSGSIAELTDLTFLYVTGSNTLSGDIGVNNMVNGIGTFYLLGLNQMQDYTSGAVWSNAPVTINPTAGYGYSSTEIDNILIDMANSASGPTSKTITLQGSSQARSAASNAAVATLEGRGCTIVTNP